MNIDNEIELVKLLGYNTAKITDKYYGIVNDKNEFKGNIICDNNLISIAISDEEHDITINGIKNTKYNPEQYFLYVSKCGKVYKMSFNFSKMKGISLKALDSSDQVLIKTDGKCFFASISTLDDKKEVWYTTSDSDKFDNKFKIYSTNLEEINNYETIRKSKKVYFQDESLFDSTMLFKINESTCSRELLDYDVNKALKINRTGYTIYKEVEDYLSKILKLQELDAFLFGEIPVIDDIDLLINEAVKSKVKKK